MKLSQGGWEPKSTNVNFSGSPQNLQCEQDDFSITRGCNKFGYILIHNPIVRHTTIHSIYRENSFSAILLNQKYDFKELLELIKN